MIQKQIVSKRSCRSYTAIVSRETLNPFSDSARMALAVLFAVINKKTRAKSVFERKFL